MRTKVILSVSLVLIVSGLLVWLYALNHLNESQIGDVSIPSITKSNNPETEADQMTTFYSINVEYPRSWRMDGSIDIGRGSSVKLSSADGRRSVSIGISRYTCVLGKTCYGELGYDPATSIQNGKGDPRFMSNSLAAYDASTRHVYVGDATTARGIHVFYYRQLWDDNLIGLFNAGMDTYFVTFWNFSPNEIDELMSGVVHVGQ